MEKKESFGHTTFAEVLSLKRKRSELFGCLIRDKWGNLEDGLWNHWVVEAVEKLDKEIEEMEGDYLLPNLDP